MEKRGIAQRRRLRIDLAEALCTLALLSDPKRAIDAGRVVIGDAALARALPALQPFALSRATRRGSAVPPIDGCRRTASAASRPILYVERAAARRMDHRAWRTSGCTDRR